VAVYVLQQVGLGDLTVRGLTWGPLVAAGEWWRLVTGGFLHGGLLHIGFNGYLLYQLGMMLEPSLGRSRFLAVYAAGLAGGSAGVMLLSWDAPTLGASGAVFGLMGAAMVLLRRRGINPWQTSIGSLVLLNLVITFVIPRVSLGGHVGGLAGGALAAAMLAAAGERTSSAAPWLVAAGLFAAAYGAGLAGPLLPSIPFLT
jgi:membrane associated rhomboid family serine protease